MYDSTRGLYDRFITCLQENNIKPTVTPKNEALQVDFRCDDEDLFSELSEIAGVDPMPLNYGQRWRVYFV
jgi:hypothetical protein